MTSLADLYDSIDDLEIEPVDSGCGSEEVSVEENKDRCNCGGNIVQELDFRLVCEECGCQIGFYEPDYKIPTFTIMKIAGPNAMQHQQKLYKSAVTKNRIKKEVIVKNYVTHGINNGIEIPIEIIDKSADLFISIKQLNNAKTVTKKSLMSACLYVNYTTKSMDTILQYMKIKRTELYSGLYFIQELKKEGYNINAEIDPLKFEIDILFNDLKLENEAIKEEVYTSILLLNKNFIGLKAKLPSKIAGITYIVLNRNKIPCNLSVLCSSKKIGIKTVSTFIEDIMGYKNVLQRLNILI